MLKIQAFTSISLALLFAGCASNDDVTAEEGEGISTRTYSFVTLTRDMRRCVAPLCGGFHLRDINRTTNAVYVSGLDFSESELDEAAIADVLEAPVEELVIYGRLGRAESRFNTRPLLVREAYRGMPGVARRSTDAFFQVTVNDPPIQCFAAPCNNSHARRLNVGGRPRIFTGTDVNATLQSFGDANWLVSRVERHNAIVAGRFEQGASFPAGRESLLVASQVFIRIPDAIGPCPEIAIRCAAGFVTAFERNEDRCITPSQCVQPLACAEFFPVCNDGYTLVEWSSAPDGCPAFACDPTFAVEEPPPPIGRCAHVRCGPGTSCVEEGDEVCVPWLTCASVLCAPSSHCRDGDRPAECVADVWATEIVAVQSSSPYRNNERREWIFTSDHEGTTHVRLNFARFDLEENYDFVIIQDADGKELARYTGRLGPFTSDIFSGSALRIVFTTDGSVTRPGFALDRIDSRTN